MRDVVIDEMVHIALLWTDDDFDKIDRGLGNLLGDMAATLKQNVPHATNEEIERALVRFMTIKSSLPTRRVVQ